MFCRGGSTQGGPTMLILSRKNQESVVVLGADGLEPSLKITVLEIKGACVRLGFAAEGKVPIHRSEVWERIKARGPPQDSTTSYVAPTA
jgi:carbon storage regulator CsrA